MPPQVSYALTIDGAAASPALLGAVRQIEVEDHAELADMLRIRLSIAVKDDGTGWTLLDDGVFNRLANLQLSITVGSGRATPIISAYIIEIESSLASEPGHSEIVVTAMDPTVLMHLSERVKAWPNMMDSDVASAIFSDASYRFTPVVESTQWSRHEDEHTLMQRGTDIQFLQQLATRNGYECFVELTDAGTVEGHFHPPRPDERPQGTLTVNMGSATNVAKFHARYDMLGPAAVKTNIIDPGDASTQQADSDAATHTEGMGDAPALPADRPRTLLLYPLGMTKVGEAQRYAQAIVDRSSWALVAEGEVDTLAYGGILRAKRPVMVRGVGRQFSGRYYVQQVLHTIRADGTYVQKFTIRRNATGLTGRETFQEDDGLQ